MSTRELEDFDPSTGHLHGCERAACSCLADLYVVAAISDEDRAIGESRVARVEALLADHEAGMKPGGKVWISGYTLRRALVDYETPGTGEHA